MFALGYDDATCGLPPNEAYYNLYLEYEEGYEAGLELCHKFELV